MADLFNKTKDSATAAAQRGIEIGQEKTGQAQKQSKGMMDTTREMASQGSQVAMDKAQQAKEQTTSILQQDKASQGSKAATDKAQLAKEQTTSIFQTTGTMVMGGLQSALDGVKNTFGWK